LPLIEGPLPLNAVGMDSMERTKYLIWFCDGEPIDNVSWTGKYAEVTSHQASMVQFAMNQQAQIKKAALACNSATVRCCVI